MQSNFFPCRISQLERDLTMKRYFIEDLRSCLKANQENDKTSNETLDSLERKVKALAEDKKALIDPMKQRLMISSLLESKLTETECAMTELESSASQQIHGLAKQSTQALETLQKELLLTSDKVEEFRTFVK
ncbi:hypothetical protein Nmel_008094, partial [Mimus melanotis]